MSPVQICHGCREVICIDCCAIMSRDLKNPAQRLGVNRLFLCCNYIYEHQKVNYANGTCLCNLHKNLGHNESACVAIVFARR
jgi:hypothetical protein